MTLTIHTGAGGDPERPLPWRDFPHLLTGQWGLIASPRWLDAVADDPALAAAPIGSGPFIVDSYEPYGSLEAHRNPDYWMTDADGQRLPYLDSISFRVIEDPQTSVEALDAGDIDLFATTNGLAITDAQAGDDEVFVTVQDTFVDSYYLLIDLSKPGPLQDRRVRSRCRWRSIATSSTTPPATGSIRRPTDCSRRASRATSPTTGCRWTRTSTPRALIADTSRPPAPTSVHARPHAPNASPSVPSCWRTGGRASVSTSRRPSPEDLIDQALAVPRTSGCSSGGATPGARRRTAPVVGSSNAAPDGTPSLNLGRLRDPAIDARHCCDGEHRGRGLVGCRRHQSVIAPSATPSAGLGAMGRDERRLSGLGQLSARRHPSARPRRPQRSVPAADPAERTTDPDHEAGPGRWPYRGRSLRRIIGVWSRRGPDRSR